MFAHYFTRFTKRVKLVPKNVKNFIPMQLSTSLYAAMRTGYAAERAGTSSSEWMSSVTRRNELIRATNELVRDVSEQRTSGVRGTCATGRAISVLNRAVTSKSELERGKKQLKVTVRNHFVKNIRATTQQCERYEFFATDCCV